MQTCTVSSWEGPKCTAFPQVLKSRNTFLHECLPRVYLGSLDNVGLEAFSILLSPLWRTDVPGGAWQERKAVQTRPWENRPRREGCGQAEVLKGRGQVWGQSDSFSKDGSWHRKNSLYPTPSLVSPFPLLASEAHEPYKAPCPAISLPPWPEARRLFYSWWLSSWVPSTWRPRPSPDSSPENSYTAFNNPFSQPPPGSHSWFCPQPLVSGFIVPPRSSHSIQCCLYHCPHHVVF